MIRDRLLAFIRKRVGNDADAEDVLQDVFVKMQSGLAAARDPEAWVFRVTRRTIIDYYRKRRRMGELPKDLATRPPSADVNAVVASWLGPLMKGLPEEDREALGVGAKELAARHGLSPTGAKSRIQRARRRLKEELRACCEIETDRRGNAVDFTPKRACASCGDPP